MSERASQIDDEQLERSLDLVQTWVETRHYRGYEPFDGLSSWARPLALGNLFAERLLQQLIRQSPVNLRPLMGVRPNDSTKGRGYMAWGYLRRHEVTGRREYLDKARTALHWLDEHKVSRFPYHSWSNHFDFVSRGGGYTKDDPILVWTALIGQVFVDAFEQTREDWFLNIAESICNWILGLPREATNQGTCLSYFADRQSSIHNANMLGASMLARTARHTGNKDSARVARSAMQYSCARQRPDGSWWYAEAPKYHWIDNFHTGYNLEALKTYIDAVGDDEFRPCLTRGLAFFTEHFFEDSGRPKYYHTRTFPVDIQCAAQAIDTLALFGEDDPRCLELAQRVTAWTFRHMRSPAGYFYYRRYPSMTAKTPMLHWGQATMFKALATLQRTMSPRRKATDCPTARGTR